MRPIGRSVLYGNDLPSNGGLLGQVITQESKVASSGQIMLKLSQSAPVERVGLSF